MSGTLNARTRLYFRRDGKATKCLHPRRGEGARTQGQLLDLILPAQPDRRMRMLKRVARFHPKTVLAYEERDPSVRNGKVLGFADREHEDSPEREVLFIRVDGIVGEGVYEREEIVQQIVVWLLDGTITWRRLLRNKRAVLASAKRWLKRNGVIYDSFGTLSLDAPIGEDGLTFGDMLEG